MRVDLLASSLVVILMGAPAVSRAAPTTWGMKAEQVKRRFPAGQIETLDTGETFLRVRTQPFGSTAALTTFTFLPLHGLNVIVHEFPERGSKARSSKEDFKRPTKAQAAVIVESVTNALRAQYGTPSHTDQGTGGSTTVWKGPKEFARISSVLIDEDRVDVRVHIETVVQYITSSKAQRALDEV